MDYEACKRVRVKINPEYRDLPAGYTQVKYLQSSGTQYIKLGLNTSTDTELEADISLSVIDNQMLWANNNTVANHISCYLSNTGNSNFGNKTLANNNLLTYFTLNTKTKVKENAEGIFINGTKRVNFNNEGTISGGDEMYIFTAKNTGASGLNGNMYDCTVKQSNTLKRDLVPCYNSNNVAGMYDKSWDNTKCGVVDLGTLTWNYVSPTSSAPNGYFVCYNVPQKASSSTNQYLNGYKNGTNPSVDKSIWGNNSLSLLCITDFRYTAVEDFKQSMSGKLLYYQRTTDTTYQPPFYTNSGTGTFILGPVVEKYITYESYQIIRPLSNNQEICFNKTIRHKAGRLPVAYQEVEYLKSDGNQYIDTGIYSKNITSAEVKFNLSNVNNYTGFGDTSTDTGSGYPASMWCEANGIKWYYSGCSPITLGSKNTDITATLPFPTQTAGSTVQIFHANGAAIGRCASGKYYYAQLFNGATVVFNGIPCYRKLDNKPGYYDLINNELHVNQGTGEFEVGPDVN